MRCESKKDTLDWLYNITAMGISDNSDEWDQIANGPVSQTLIRFSSKILMQRFILASRIEILSPPIFSKLKVAEKVQKHCPEKPTTTPS